MIYRKKMNDEYIALTASKGEIIANEGGDTQWKIEPKPSAPIKGKRVPCIDADSSVSRPKKRKKSAPTKGKAKKLQSASVSKAKSTGAAKQLSKAKSTGPATQLSQAKAAPSDKNREALKNLIRLYDLHKADIFSAEEFSRFSAPCIEALRTVVESE